MKRNTATGRVGPGAARHVRSRAGPGQEQGKLSGEEAQTIGVEAVVYGLPLVVMDLTKRVSTNVPGPQPNTHAPNPVRVAERQNQAKTLSLQQTGGAQRKAHRIMCSV